MTDCTHIDTPGFIAEPRVPLYPYTVVPPGEDTGFVIGPMSVSVHPFRLCPGAYLDVVTAHTEQAAQDFSMRFWVARMVLGSPDLATPESARSWEPGKLIPRVVTLYDRSQPLPVSLGLIAPMDPGFYFVHAQNRTNFVNRFSLRVVPRGVEGP